MMEELHRLGVQTVCIAPGSRSTPLTWAAAQHRELETVVHFDERGLAFHALGIAKASHRPVAIVCTSGSAVANLLPAVVEASQTHIPLILLTADRPFELVDCGANQTIKQPGIFGEYVRHEVNLPCPDVALAPNVLLTTLDHAVFMATGPNAGPVHIDCPFREPLAPDEDGVDISGYCEPLERWKDSDTSFTRYPYEGRNPDYDFDAFQSAKRAILLIGQSVMPEELGFAIALSTVYELPVVADIGSHVRLDGQLENLVAHADLILITKQKSHLESLDVVIHIGGPIVSKRLQTLFESDPPEHYIRIAQGYERLDPGHLTTQRYTICSNHQPLLYTEKINIDTTWRDNLITASQTIGSFLAGRFSGNDITEPGVVRAITQTETDALFLGNSMPIRDADMFGDPGGYVASVFTNRGASGIDGNIATAAGIARENGSITAVLGDLAVLHDLNSLALLKTNKVVLVVINNQGGGIFSMLPVSDHGELVEEFFGTPHAMTFKSAAKQFDLTYDCPTTMSDFNATYEAALSRETSSIIEVRTDRKENASFHEQLQQNIIDFMNNEME